MSINQPDKNQLYAGADTPQPFPLLVSDPARIGSFWLDARLTANASGVVYFAHEDAKPSVLLLTLNEGATNDAAARDRLAGEVNRMHDEAVVARGGWGQDSGRLGAKFRYDDDAPSTPGSPKLSPWVALAYDGRPHALDEANRLLTTIDLSSMASLGKESGPDYKLPWVNDSAAGKNRIWPLPWPGRHDKAGWMPIFTSWLLMLMLAGLALLIAVLIFQNTPPEQPQPPVPTQQQSSSSDSQQSQSSSSQPSDSQSPQSPSPSDSQSPSASDSQSASPSNSQSQSPSPDSASPSQSEQHGSPSKDPSMGASGSGTASGTGTPHQQNTKL